MTAPDWVRMTALRVSGAPGHWLPIRACEAAEAGAVQPFAYFRLVFVTGMGITVFAGEIRWNVALEAAAVVVAAGVFTALREHARRRVNGA